MEGKIIDLWKEVEEFRNLVASLFRHTDCTWQNNVFMNEMELPQILGKQLIKTSKLS